jgi:hypothetical protein
MAQPQRQIRSRGDLQGVVHTSKRILYRLLSDAQLLGNGLIRQSTRYELGDLILSRGQLHTSVGKAERVEVHAHQLERDFEPFDRASVHLEGRDFCDTEGIADLVE